MTSIPTSTSTGPVQRSCVQSITSISKRPASPEPRKHPLKQKQDQRAVVLQVGRISFKLGVSNPTLGLPDERLNLRNAGLDGFSPGGATTYVKYIARVRNKSMPSKAI